MAFSAVNEHRLPRWVKVRQCFPSEAIGDAGREVRQELSRVGLERSLRPGHRVAIAVGSRGIPRLSELVASTAAEIRRLGAHPFIVPAMGSHGGATAEGQRDILMGYGISEEATGAEILSSMDVIELGTTDRGDPVFFDRLAANADGVIAINRIKPHTSFVADHGSGIAKMLVVGLGNHAGATAFHREGVIGLRESIPRALELIIRRVPFVIGIGLVENAYHKLALIRAMKAGEIMDVEKELLKKAKELMPRLPARKIDVLIVDRMGKDISGTGMDTNVIGRIRIRGEREPSEPDIKTIVVLDLTEDSHGNAVGIGLADFTTERLVRKIHYDDLRANVLTSTFSERAKIPLYLPTDREAIMAALATCWGVEPNQAKIMHIRDTLNLFELDVSEPLLKTLDNVGTGRIEVIRGPQEVTFDEDCNLKIDAEH